jgi:uncharacterized caspase-like protein
MTRRALLLACGTYTDNLPALSSSLPDAKRLDAILSRDGVGDFQTKIVLDPELVEAQFAIQEILQSADSADLVVIYLSGHGVKDAYGRWYLALPKTNLLALAATALSGRYLREQLADTACRKLAVILDTCFAGAFSRDLIAKSVTVASGVPEELLEHGQVVMSATSAVQLAFETMGDNATSIFTSTMCDGIETGAADLDGDGWISADELFAFTASKVRESAFPQTPEMSTVGVTVPMRIAKALRPRRSTELDPEVLLALNSSHAELRMGAARVLAKYASASNRDRGSLARAKLRTLRDDRNSKVRRFVTETLGYGYRPPLTAPVRVETGVQPRPSDMWAVVNAKELRTRTSQVVEFASFDDTLEGIMTVRFDFTTSQQVEIMSTDRYRLDWHSVPIKSNGGTPFAASISVDDYPSILRQMPDSDVRFSLNEDELQVSFNNKLLSIELIKSQFPDHGRLVSPTGPTCSVDRSLFMNALTSVTENFRRSADAPIRLRMPDAERQVIEIISEVSSGAPVEVSVPASGVMDGLDVALNAYFFLTGLETFDDDRIWFGMSRSVVFLVLNNELELGASHRYVMVPLSTGSK